MLLCQVDLWFKTGAKQDSIIRSILFCVYLNGLLCQLPAVAIGCRIRKLFTDLLTYAGDNIVLPVLTVRAMCDDHICNVFPITFNAKPNLNTCCSSLLPKSANLAEWKSGVRAPSILNVNKITDAAKIVSIASE